jgi:hypothetical protein
LRQCYKDIIEAGSVRFQSTRLVQEFRVDHCGCSTEESYVEFETGHGGWARCEGLCVSRLSNDVWQHQ